MPALLDLSGQRFGRLTVQRREKGCWVCLCDCGCTARVDGVNLRKGLTKSCGCFRRDQSKKRGLQSARHGHYVGGKPSLTWRSWKGMLDRCTLPSHVSFKDYGGRGIKVCERWRSSFEAFLLDVGERPSKAHSIDRIDHNGDYAPGNVRWATELEQKQNRRNARLLTFEGRTQTVRRWALEVGIPPGTAYGRLYAGRSIEEILGKAETSPQNPPVIPLPG